MRHRKPLILLVAAVVAVTAMNGLGAIPPAHPAPGEVHIVAGWHITERAAPTPADRNRRRIEAHREGTGWSVDFLFQGSEAGSREMLETSWMVNMDDPVNGSCSDGSDSQFVDPPAAQRGRFRESLLASMTAAQSHCHRDGDFLAAMRSGLDEALVAADGLLRRP